tara:strand:+ start:76 stop:279 length:204 start_codon:yes stop_codon:yes gene_type:complete
MTITPDEPTEWRLYFDPFDDDMDGNGWNVVSVQPDDFVAARFPSSTEAATWLRDTCALLKLGHNNEG